MSESNSVSGEPRTACWKWGICWLMFLATMLNYMDRQALGNTAPFVMAEFKMSREDYGRVERAFGYAYAASQICAGWFVDRLSLRWMYAGGVLLWSLAGFATGFAPDLSVLLVCRVMLGVTEAVNWPAAVRTTQRILPSRDRTLGNGIFNSGGAVGAVLTPLAVTWLVTADAPERWRLVFQIIGAIGLFWVIAWLWLVRGARQVVIEHGDATLPDLAKTTAAPVSFWRLFTRRQIWIVMVVSVAVNACWHFYRVWLPLYLVDERGFSKSTTMQYAVAAYYVAADLGSLGAGMATKWLVLRGVPVAWARWRVMLVCALLTSLSALAVACRSDGAFLAVAMLVAAGNLGQFAGFFAFSQDVSPRHTALVLGLMGTLAWLCTSSLQPWVGAIADRTHTFVPMLRAIGVVPMVAVFALSFWPAVPESKSG
jgi:ACS family hexuronate transporter-like MFS transporter